MEQEAQAPVQAEQVQANTQSDLDNALQQPDVPDKFKAEDGSLDSGKLLDSYRNIESKLGSMYSIPTEDASPEKWAEFEQRIASTGRFVSKPVSNEPEAMDQFYNQLGRPESIDGYDLELAEEIKDFVDPNMLGTYKQVAHEAGLNKQQAQALMDFELERLNQQAELSLQARNSAEQQLRQSWGPDYDNRMAGAKAAASAYAEKYPDAVQELLNGPAGNNPALLSMLSELGHSMRESGHVGAVNAPQYGVSSDAAKEQIGEILENRSHAYHNEYDPRHREAVAKVQKLYSIAYPDG
jgi:hypothetical protein